MLTMVDKKAVQHFNELILVVLLVTCLAGCGEGRAIHEERVAKLQSTYEAFVRVDAAIGVGVNYLGYGPLVRDAAAAIAIYESEDDEAREVEDMLKQVLEMYALAGAAWGTKFAEYEYSAWREFKEEHPEVESARDIDHGVQLLWMHASVNLAIARVLFDEYKER